MTMDPKELIKQYQKAIVDTYQRERLNCLCGLDGKFLLNGKNILLWHSEVISKAAKHNRKLEYTKNVQDIYFCSNELLYFTASLYLYRPYIHNPVARLRKMRSCFPSERWSCFRRSCFFRYAMSGQRLNSGLRSSYGDFKQTGFNHKLTIVMDHSHCLGFNWRIRISSGLTWESIFQLSSGGHRRAFAFSNLNHDVLRASIVHRKV